jgi:hypothetical protein
MEPLEPVEERVVLCSGAPTPTREIVLRRQIRFALRLREVPVRRAQGEIRLLRIALLRAVAQVALEPLSP